MQFGHWTNLEGTLYTMIAVLQTDPGLGKLVLFLRLFFCWKKCTTPWYIPKTNRIHGTGVYLPTFCRFFRKGIDKYTMPYTDPIRKNELRQKTSV